MNTINVSINFKERKCLVEGITMTEGDYNTSKMVFDFDIPTGVKMLEMKNPLGEIVYLDEIIDNEVVLVGKAQVIKVENDITYYKYLDNGENIYWYDKENDKLYNDLMVEIPEFNLEDYTPVLVNASLFNVAGEYVFEVSLYENDGRLTSAYGTLDVAPEQVNLNDPHGEIKYPILEDLTNKVAEIQEDITELSLDVADLEENKQDTLVSGENIKTINNQSLLGDGDLNIDVPTKLSDLEDDNTHRTVTDTEKTTWDNKSDFSGDYNDLQNKPSIPSKTSDLNNDSGFITKDVNDLTNYTTTSDMNTAISNAVGTETTNRQNADIALQNQIDAITASSDVVDVVGTYTDLQNYDTSSLTADDVIKVLQDSTHSDALSYYRWVIVSNVGSWNYVGSEGPFYTKGETDTLLNGKVGFTDYASSSKGGVIKTDTSFGTGTSNNGNIYALEKSYTDYPSMSNYAFIGKGTLENVITGKGLVSNTNYASASNAGVIKTGNYWAIGTQQDTGNVYAVVKTYNEYTSGSTNMFISKGTLENVITGKDLTTKAYVDGLVGDIGTAIDLINGESVGD